MPKLRATAYQAIAFGSLSPAKCLMSPSFNISILGAKRVSLLLTSHPPERFPLAELLNYVVLKTVAGKDATKPFKKLHNERILKTHQYKDLCIGILKEEGKGSAPQKEGGIWALLGWRKTDVTTSSG